MDALIPFLLEHWVLSSAFVVVVLLLIINEMRHRQFGVNAVSPQEAVQLMNHHGGCVIDIRGAEEFNNGHITHAKHVNPVELDKKLAKLQRYKTKPVILVCASGQDAPKIGGQLIAAGFENVYLMSGGMHAWKGEGLPVVK